MPASPGTSQSPWFPGSLRAIVATHLNMSQILPISNTFSFVNPWVRPYVPLIFASENIVTVFKNSDSPGKVVTSGPFFFWTFPTFSFHPGYICLESTHAQAHTLMNTHTFTHMHPCNTHTHTATHMHPYNKHTYVHTQLHIRTHAYTYTHTWCTSIHTHIYIHTVKEQREESYSNSPTHVQTWV